MNIIKTVGKHWGKVIIGLVIIGGSGYGIWQKYGIAVAPTHYVLQRVARGTIINSVNGSGQITVSNQVDIKAKASGDVLNVLVKNGDTVKAGQIIAQLNSRDAQKSVRDAEASLLSAKLSLEKTVQPTDDLSLLQANHALAQSMELKQQAIDGLKKTYDDGFNTVANAFLDLPTIVSGLENVLYSSALDPNQYNIDWYLNHGISYSEDSRNKLLQYRQDLDAAYQAARAKYQKNLEDYKKITRQSDVSEQDALILETYETVKILADTIKSASTYIGVVVDLGSVAQINFVKPAVVATHQATLDGYTGKTNGHLLNLLSIKQSISNAQDNIKSYDRSIAEKTESLAKLKAGADAIDIKSAELSITQRQNALFDAQEKLADYTIRAPFSGIIAALNIKKGDTLSSSGAVATLIAEQKLVEISLNEVDLAKIKIGDKAVVTFDAIPDLSISGHVAEIDALGTITQGVVTYGLKITLDTQDDRIKPGMSISTSIITDIKQDVLSIPVAAVKNTGGSNYVEAPSELIDSSQPIGGSVGALLSQPVKRITIEVGLANDTTVEVISGLKENDLFIARTILPATQKTTATSGQSLIPITGRGATGGNAARSAATGR